MLLPLHNLLPDTGCMRQHFAALTCSISAAAGATAFCWYAPLLIHMTSPDFHLPLTTSDTSWLVSSVMLGSMVSVIPIALLGDRLGRRWLILASGPTLACSFIALAFLDSLALVIAVRLVQGACLAIITVVCPVYVAEVTEPRIRGSASCHIQTLWNAGILFTYCTGPYLSHWSYSFACTALPVLSTASFACMPESPYFLLMKGKKEDAEKALSWLRGGKPVDDECKTIAASIQKEFQDKGSWKDLFLTADGRRSLIIVQLCCLTKYMGGMPAFINYLSQTMGEASLEHLDHHQVTIGFGALLTTSSFASYILSDKIKRRPLLISSCLSCFIFLSVISGYYFMEFNSSVDTTSFSWVFYLSLIGFIFASNIGLNTLMATVQAENFSTSARSMGGAITQIIGFAIVFADMAKYQIVQDEIGVYLNYCIYAGVSLIGAICMYILLEETAGRSLIQIQLDRTVSRIKRASVRAMNKSLRLVSTAPTQIPQ